MLYLGGHLRARLRHLSSRIREHEAAGAPGTARLGEGTEEVGDRVGETGLHLSVTASPCARDPSHMEPALIRDSVQLGSKLCVLPVRKESWGGQEQQRQGDPREGAGKRGMVQPPRLSDRNGVSAIASASRRIRTQACSTQGRPLCKPNSACSHSPRPQPGAAGGTPSPCE